MKDYIEIHPLARADPSGLPNLAEATKLASANHDVGYLSYENGRFWVVWNETWGMCTYPLQMYFSDSITTYLDQAGKPVALVTSNGLVCDLRMPDYKPSPPYLAMVPCLYCGVTNNRGHDPLKHIDPFLGTKTHED